MTEKVRLVVHGGRVGRLRWIGRLEATWTDSRKQREIVGQLSAVLSSSRVRADFEPSVEFEEGGR